MVAINDQALPLISPLPPLFSSLLVWICGGGGRSRDTTLGFVKEMGRTLGKGNWPLLFTRVLYRHYSTGCFFLFLKLAKIVSSWSELQTTHMSSQIECVQWALCIYSLWLFI
jgi:hypothetical protein